MHRRQFLRYAAALAGTTVVGGSLWQEALAAFPAASGPGPYGPLGAPDANGLRLPAGFTSRVVARSLQVVPGTGYTWHVYPDGGACFADGDGWIYVSNSESPNFPALNAGGASALRFDAAGNVIDAYKILTGSAINCAGGAMPWGTWLSCEEKADGLVFECDPTRADSGVARPALGRFAHEAAAADPDGRHVYLTEDVPDGRFYRFAPNRWGDLSAGVLEVAKVDAGQVTWFPVSDPDPADPFTNPTRLQVPDSTPFNGGEGIVYQRGRVFFTTKGDNRVWVYETLTGRIAVLYDDDLDPGAQLTGVDNAEIANSGDLLIAEDKSSTQQIVLIAPDGSASPLVEMDQANSEFAGPAFSPDGTRLYLSSQRGDAPGANYGVTYEVSGPFRRFAATVASCASPV